MVRVDIVRDSIYSLTLRVRRGEVEEYCRKDDRGVLYFHARYAICRFIEQNWEICHNKTIARTWKSSAIRSINRNPLIFRKSDENPGFWTLETCASQRRGAMSAIAKLANPPPAPLTPRLHNDLNDIKLPGDRPQKKGYKYECYCGKGYASRFGKLLTCGKCRKLFHVECVAPARREEARFPMYPGEVSYSFKCSKCNSHEYFCREAKTWKEIVHDALFNLALEDIAGRKDVPRSNFSLEEILGYIEQHWAGLCYGKCKSSTWTEKAEKVLKEFVLLGVVKSAAENERFVLRSGPENDPKLVEIPAECK